MYRTSLLDEEYLTLFFGCKWMYSEL